MPAQIYTTFTNPNTVGNQVIVSVLGNPVLGLSSVLQIVGHGEYEVTTVFTPAANAILRSYIFRLKRKFDSVGATVPAGSILNITGEGDAYSVLPYATSVILNFQESNYRRVDLSGNITFNAYNHCAAESMVVLVVNHGVSHTLTFPDQWTWIGSAGRPASIAANKTGVLSITCFGFSNADVVAVWAEQA